MGASVITKDKKTVQDYKQLPEGALYQLINGVLIMTPAPRRKHQKLIGEIFKQIAVFLDSNPFGEVYIAPFDVYLDDENIVQPDICFIAQKNISILTDDGAEGVPDMVIEILSPSNAYYDLKSKLQLYQKYGVKEYFIVDPEDNLVIAYALIDGKYKEVYQEANKIVSKILGTDISW
jgi:Uma2 family endonuclease